jgi:predicted nucleotidyltransferase
MPFEELQQLLAEEPALEFAVLVGSRAAGTATDKSDWDIALRWTHDIHAADTLKLSEQTRQRVATALSVPTERIDIIDLATARLTMRAVVAEEGIVLAGADSLAWHHFLTQTWAELEDFYWRKTHAA